ncbi:aspartyl protease family protein At5g10770-like [Hibiscus syriacus]|nr:aspartyl protease family protein At5g10770-like [Hibiscus syriacus]
MVDTLHIEDEYEIPKFVFLCAAHVEGNFDDANGILGLGPASTGYGGSNAFTSQTAAMFHKVFCYCLPRLEDSKGYVHFGDKARENCPFSGSYTPLLKDTSDPNFYYVNLIAITIGQKRVNIGTSSGVSSPRTILDSGTVITRLPSSVYSELRSEFKGLMSKYPPVPPLDNVLDTCYNLEGYGKPEIPTMVLHFKNLDLNLDETAVTWKANGTSQVCLAFAETDGLAIIGNHQHQKRNMLYNIPDQRVEIGPGNC